MPNNFRLLTRVGATQAWTPTYLGPNLLKAWWNSDDHGTVRMTDDGGGLISSWVDRQGGLALTGTTTLRPTWGAASWAPTGAATGSAVVSASGNRLQALTMGNVPTGATAGEIWTLIQLAQNNPIGTACPFGYGGTSGATSRQHFFFSSGGFPHVRLNDGTNSVSSTDSPVAAQGYCLIGSFWSGTTAACRINGADMTPASGTIATLNTGTTTVRMCTTAGNSFTFIGPIKQVLVTATLTTAQRQLMEGYLAWSGWPTGPAASSFPLPITHPYYQRAPLIGN